MSDWSDVARALLGSWPSVVASWGQEGIAAYVAELQARGLDRGAALASIRASDAALPPSAGQLAAVARRGPERSTFIEAYSAIYDSRPACGGRGVLWTHARNSEETEHEAQLDRAFEIDPLLGAFVRSYGLGRLLRLEVDHEDYGHIRKRELQEAWEQFAEANAHRGAAALAERRRRDLGRGPRRLDPRTALPAGASS